MPSYYHPREGNVLGGYYVEGDQYGLGRSYDGSGGGIVYDDLDDLFGKVPPQTWYRLTITGIPTKDSPETGNPFYNPNNDPPISRSYLKYSGDIEAALAATEDLDEYGTGEEFASYLTNPEDQGWYRVDRIEVVELNESEL
jgi:hypothetical protein